MKRLRENRIKELIDIVHDENAYEVGPLDRRDLRWALVELLVFRQGGIDARESKPSDPILEQAARVVA